MGIGVGFLTGVHAGVALVEGGEAGVASLESSVSIFTSKGSGLIVTEAEKDPSSSPFDSQICIAGGTFSGRDSRLSSHFATSGGAGDR